MNEWMKFFRSTWSCSHVFAPQYFMLSGLNLRSIAYFLYDWVAVSDFHFCCDKYPKLSNLKGHPFIISQFCSSEVWLICLGSHKVKMQVWARLGTPLTRPGKIHFPRLWDWGPFTCWLSARICYLLGGAAHAHMVPPSSKLQEQVWVLLTH